MITHLPCLGCGSQLGLTGSLSPAPFFKQCLGHRDLLEEHGQYDDKIRRNKVTVEVDGDFKIHKITAARQPLTDTSKLAARFKLTSAVGTLHFCFSILVAHLLIITHLVDEAILPKDIVNDGKGTRREEDMETEFLPRAETPSNAAGDRLNLVNNVHVRQMPH